ncbi:hypothetical protein DZJ_23500 [Dickeya ananatis]
MVDNISPYLVEGSRLAIIPRNSPLIKGVPPLLFGNKPTDGGYLLLDRFERDELLKQEPQAERWLKKVLGADEFFNGKERWCLWLVEASVADLESMPLVGKRVLAVKKCPS